MSATIDATELAGAARWASRALPQKATNPVMAGSVIEVREGILSVRAYDYVTSASATAQADGELDTFLVHGKLFADVAARLKGDVTLDFEGTWLVIRAGRERFRLPMMAMDDYPATPLPQDADAPAAGFDEAIARVAVAAAPEIAGSVPVLTGINIEAAAGELVLSATDSYRMVQERLPWDGVDHETLNIPARRLKDLSKELGDKPSLGFGSGLSLTAGTRSASIGSVDGAFPDLDRYISGHIAVADGFLYVDREALVRAIQSAGMFAEKNGPIYLDLSTDAITVIAAGVGDGDGEIVVEAAYDGPERRIAMQPAFLADALATTPGPVCHLSLPPVAKASGGVVVHACSEIGADVDRSHVHLVMSLRIL